MPNLTGLTTRQAVTWLQSRGVDVRLYGRGTVTEQSPSAGQPLPSRAMLTGDSD
jgi:cell division protein FtsI (penicillin-binding protein 3)